MCLGWPWTLWCCWRWPSPPKCCGLASPMVFLSPMCSGCPHLSFQHRSLSTLTPLSAHLNFHLGVTDLSNLTFFFFNFNLKQSSYLSVFPVLGPQVYATMLDSNLVHLKQNLFFLQSNPAQQTASFVVSAKTSLIMVSPLSYTTFSKALDNPISSPISSHPWQPPWVEGLCPGCCKVS